MGAKNDDGDPEDAEDGNSCSHSHCARGAGAADGNEHADQR